MTKNEAKTEFRKLISQRNKEADQITEEAKANGTYRMGLDSNRHLYEKLDEKYKKKIEELKAQIDEE